MYILKNKVKVRSGRVFNWTMRDGKQKLPIRLQISVVNTPEDGLAVVLGAKTKLPQEVDVLSTGRDRTFQGKEYWTKSIALTLVHNGKIYLLFSAEEINAKSITLYFHAYLPAELGDGDMKYDERQNYESAPKAG